MSEGNMYVRYGIYSVDDIRRHYEKHNDRPHWFEPNAMKFFKCKLDGQVWACSKTNEFLFIWSEKGPNMKRRYTVMKYDPRRAAIGDASGFQEFASLEIAKRWAQRESGNV